MTEVSALTGSALDAQVQSGLSGLTGCAMLSGTVPGAMNMMPPEIASTMASVGKWTMPAPLPPEQNKLPLPPTPHGPKTP